MARETELALAVIGEDPESVVDRVARLSRIVAQQVTELFTRMEESGELDRYPTTSLAEKLAARSSR